MLIKELNTDKKLVTVVLNYDELKCINNSMFEVSGLPDDKKDKEFNEVYAKIIELFALLKHGKVPEFELEKMCELLSIVTKTEKACGGVFNK